MPADPSLLVVALTVLVVGYRGWRSRMQADPGSARTTTAEALRGAAGVAAIVVALGTGLDDLAHVSFAWHMVQHQLLLLVAAPLLASADPVATLRAAVGRSPSAPSGRRRDRLGIGALVAGVLAIATLLAWHLPAAYDAALASAPVHRIEHLTLLGTATLMWAAALAAARDDRVFAAVSVLAATAIIGAGLGVVLLTSSAPLYAYASAGADALDQQRLGGALMKVGALLVHAGAAVWLLTRWLGRLEGEDGSVPSSPPAPAEVPSA